MVQNKLSEWISVNDMLPNCDGKYLAYRRIYGTPFQTVVNYTNFYNGNDADYTIRKGTRCFYVYDSEYGDCKIDGITHWMSLPEPPEDD